MFRGRVPELPPPPQAYPPDHRYVIPQQRPFGVSFHLGGLSPSQCTLTSNRVPELAQGFPCGCVQSTHTNDTRYQITTSVLFDHYETHYKFCLLLHKEKQHQTIFYIFYAVNVNIAGDIIEDKIEF